MFEREHHRRVATVLETMDSVDLATHACLFGGGTAMALRYGEYRESVDIDFLISDLDGYRRLRQRLTGPDGVQVLAKPGRVLNQVRDIRADQYGIRTMLRIDGVDIKFEIVLEGRMALDAPGAQDQICGVSTLTARDMAASKLLANSDRWRDDAVFSRDLIDLAMMVPTKKLLHRAIDKAKPAYGHSVVADLVKAIQGMRGRPQRLEQCMRAMRIETVPKAVLWSRIRTLLKALDDPNQAQMPP